MTQIERNIRASHAESFPEDVVIDVDWVGEVERQENVVDYYRVETETETVYRYYVDKAGTVVDSEGAWS